MAQDGGDDIAAAAAPGIVRTAGGLSLAAGATALLVVVQAFSGFIVTGGVVVWLALVGVFGAATAAGGLGLLRGRSWAGTCAVAAGALGTLLDAAWFVRALLGGFISVFVMLAPWLALAATVCAIASLGALKRVTAARERLREQGLDMGV